MDHAETLERIELAAAEPDGLERLMAGDTPESGAVAGHLAGCPSCVAELARVRRTSMLVREAVESAPDPALRERTLAFVRAVGRDRSRGEAAMADAVVSAAEALAPGAIVAAGEGPAIPAGPGLPVLPGAAVAAPARPSAIRQVEARPARPAWLRWGALAAALVVAVGLGFGAASQGSPADRLAREVAVLEDATATTMRLEALPDSRRVALAATAAAPGATGTLLMSPSSGELVMVASGLGPLADGEEYGCWVEVDGSRTRIGRMYPGGALQSWAGPVDGLAALPPDAVFGVSRVPAGGGDGEPVLVGGG